MISGCSQHRMEFGPRALGARSILASPLHACMQARLNEIKDREDFRPVAPVVLEEEAARWFANANKSPFMTRGEPIVTSGLHCLHISIDSPIARTYERIRVRAHFERVVANLERIHAARKRLGSTYPHLRIVMVIMRQNLHEL